jgi:hypothetical protein
MLLYVEELTLSDKHKAQRSARIHVRCLYVHVTMHTQRKQERLKNFKS